MVKVNVKHGKNKYELDMVVEEPVEVFRAQLFAVTGVPPERQKILGFKGGPLKVRCRWRSFARHSIDRLARARHAFSAASPRSLALCC